MSNIDVKSLLKATEMSLKEPAKAEPTKYEKCLVYWVLEKKTTIIPADFISDKVMRKTGAHTKARFRKGGKTYPVKVINVSDDMKTLEEMQSSLCKDLLNEEGGGDSTAKESSSETNVSSNKKGSKPLKKRKDDSADASKSASPKKMKKRESGGLETSKQIIKAKAEAAKIICGEILGSQNSKKIESLPKVIDISKAVDISITQDYRTGTLESWTNECKWTAAAPDDTWQESSCLELLQSDVQLPYQQFDEQLAQVTAERDQALLRVQQLEHELEEANNRMPFQATSDSASMKLYHKFSCEEDGHTKKYCKKSSETSLPDTRRKLPFIPIHENPIYPATPSTNQYTLQETTETYHNSSPFPQQHIYSQSYTDLSPPQQTQFTSKFYNEPQTQISSHTFQDTTPSHTQQTAIPFTQSQSLQSPLQTAIPFTQSQSLQSPLQTALPFTKSQSLQSPLQTAVNSDWSSPITKNGDHKIELAENTGVFITKSQHAQLTMHGYANPRKVLLRLLDMLIDQQTLAMSSALGSRSAINKKGEQGQTVPIPLEIKSGISAYLQKHCSKGEELTKSTKDINSIINSKCGTARRYLKQ